MFLEIFVMFLMCAFLIYNTCKYSWKVSYSLMTCIYYFVISFLISSVMVSINNNANEYCVTAEIGVLGTICNDMYPKDYFFLKVYCLPEKQTKILSNFTCWLLFSYIRGSRVQLHSISKKQDVLMLIVQSMNLLQAAFLNHILNFYFHLTIKN